VTNPIKKTDHHQALRENENKKRTTQVRRKRKGQKRQLSRKRKGKRRQLSQGIQPLLCRLAYFLSWLRFSLGICDQSIQGAFVMIYIIYSGIPISRTLSISNLPKFPPQSKTVILPPISRTLQFQTNFRFLCRDFTVILLLKVDVNWSKNKVVILLATLNF